MTRPPPSSTLFPYTTLFRSSGLLAERPHVRGERRGARGGRKRRERVRLLRRPPLCERPSALRPPPDWLREGCRPALPDYADRKSIRLNSSHGYISYAVFCLK